MKQAVNQVLAGTPRYAVPNPKGIASPSPGLPGGYPGSRAKMFSQPQRGCAATFSNRRNPVGVEFNLHLSPRVASPTRQPWAEGRSPFGAGTVFLWR